MIVYMPAGQWVMGRHGTEMPKDKKRQKFKEKEKCDENRECGTKDSCRQRGFPFLCRKKDMKRILLVAALMATVSCGLEEVSRRPQSGAGDVWLGPGMNAGKDDPDKTVVYVTAVEYPEGYDWRTDREKGSVKCSLVVYADDVPMMKVAAGDEYEVSTDPDMHRMVEGHLYTDYSTDAETVIKKDGKEVVRYAGREMICGLFVEDDDIYTLGHPRQGDGFSYRRNGDIVLERSTGRSFANLHKDGGSICFSFMEPIEAQDSIIERYYLVRDGDIVQVAVREDVRKVWDVISYEGETIYLASVIGVSSPVLFRSGSMHALEMPPMSEMLTCRLMADDGSFCMEGLYARKGKPLTSGLWDGRGKASFFDDGMTVASVCMNGDGVCCVLNGSSEKLKGVIYRCGETFHMPPGYASVGSSPAAMADGILHVGLSSLSGGKPVVWKDGAVNQLDINGFISTITVREGRQSSQTSVLD